MKVSHVALLVLGSLIASATALAMPNEHFQGKPEFAAGDKLGAWVWHDAEGQHVRFTTVDNKVARKFTGKVCGKEASDLKPVRTDVGDGIRIGPEGHCIVFDFTTNAGVDGFDFRMTEGDIAYDFNINGEPLPVDKIHIGARGISPKNNPFTLNRDEK